MLDSSIRGQCGAVPDSFMGGSYADNNSLQAVCQKGEQHETATIRNHYAFIIGNSKRTLFNYKSGNKNREVNE